MADFSITPEIRELRRETQAFMEGHIYPNEARLEEGGEGAEALMRELQARVKALGMWAPHMPAEVGGMGIGFLRYA